MCDIMATKQKYMAIILDNGMKKIIAENVDIPQAVKKLRANMGKYMWVDEISGYVIPQGVLKQRDDGVPYGWVGSLHVAKYDSNKKPVFAYTVRKKGQSLDKVSHDFIVKADGTMLKGKW